MNGTQAQAMRGEPVRETTYQWATGGSLMESVGAIGAVIIAIIGLAGILSGTLAAVATIIVGAAILMEGGAMGTSYREVVAHTNAGETQAEELSGGATAEFMGGVAGIVLGILALFGLVPETLLAVAVLVFGATILLSSAATAQLAGFRGDATTPAVARHSTARSGQVLVGLASVVLGILAIIGLQPLVLILVALLSLGCAGLLSGSVFGTGRLLGFSRR